MSKEEFLDYIKIFMLIIAIICIYTAIESDKKLIQTVNSLNEQLQLTQQELDQLKTDYRKDRPLMLGRKARIQKVTLTAYSPEIRQTDSTPFQTAMMTQVRGDGIAVSRDLFALGWTFNKKVYIPQQGIFIINDLMGITAADKVTTKTIDLFFFNHNDAKTFTPRSSLAYLID